MPIFFFAAGFLYRHQLPNLKSNFLKRKAYRLLVPLLFIGIFFLTPIRIVLHMASFRDAIITFNNMAHLWFLIALFYIFVFFYLIRNTIGKLNIWIGFVILYVFTISTIHYLQLNSAQDFVIYFYLGYVVYSHREKFITSNKFLLLFFVLHVITAALVLNGIKIGIIAALVSVMTIYIFCNRIVYKYPSILDNSVFQVLNRNSMLIYLFHEPLIYIVLVYLIPITTNPVIIVSCSFGISILVSLALSKIVWASRYLRFLTGNGAN